MQLSDLMIICCFISSLSQYYFPAMKKKILTIINYYFLGYVVIKNQPTITNVVFNLDIPKIVELKK